MAKCDDLFCAAKIIHPTLATRLQVGPGRQHRLPMERFRKECEFMSSIRHPNIVQYIGVCKDETTNLPVLLMELMDDSLTKFLENSPRDSTPYHVQVNTCLDIARALSFLHSNKIVHRDLSSNNVLLIGNVRAKVTDFGMARLSINPNDFSNTVCPGTSVYMPPEALEEKPKYSEMIDCFSFGVIVLQILTHEFPNPGDRHKIVHIDDPRFPRGLRADVPELERRQNHISMVDSKHPLLAIARECLNDSDDRRPSAQMLCEKVSVLKESTEYKSSIMPIEKEPKFEVEDIHKLRQSLDQKILELEHQNEQLKKQLNSQEETVEVFKARNDDLECKLRQMMKELSNQTSKGEESSCGKSTSTSTTLERQISEPVSPKEKRQAQRSEAFHERAPRSNSLQFSWQKLKLPPCAIEKECDAVVDGKIVYFYNSKDQEIYAFDTSLNVWCVLKSSPSTYCSLALVNGLLTTVGGMSGGSYSNKLFSLDSESRWAEIFPPMPTRRSQATSLCTKEHLIVAGGHGDRGLLLRAGVLATIEVMNTTSKQWSSAGYLPQPMYQASAAICSERLYMLGGIEAESKPIKRMHMCSLSDLLPSNKSTWLRKVVSSTPVVWSQTVFDIPVTRSTCVSLCDRLLAVGGKLSQAQETTAAIYAFSELTDSWEVVSHMDVGRCNCFAAVVPDNKLLVVGGSVNSSTAAVADDSITACAEIGVVTVI